jgi:hypothetical protein
MNVSTYRFAFSMSRKISHLYAPSRRPNPRMLTNRFEKFRGLFWSNLVFDRDQHWAKVVVCRQGAVLRYQ